MVLDSKFKVEGFDPLQAPFREAEYIHVYIFIYICIYIYIYIYIYIFKHV